MNIEIDYQVLPKSLNDWCKHADVTSDHVEHYHKYLLANTETHHYNEQSLTEWLLQETLKFSSNNYALV